MISQNQKRKVEAIQDQSPLQRLYVVMNGRGKHVISSEGKTKRRRETGEVSEHDPLMGTGELDVAQTMMVYLEV